MSCLPGQSMLPTRGTVNRTDFDQLVKIRKAVEVLQQSARHVKWSNDDLKWQAFDNWASWHDLLWNVDDIMERYGIAEWSDQREGWVYTGVEGGGYVCCS